MSDGRVARLYGRSPRRLQELLLAARAWQVRRERTGGSFREQLREAESLTFASPQRLRDYRVQRWERVLRPALRRIPPLADWDVPLEQLPSTPVLTKDRLREAPESWRASNWRRPSVQVLHTSGTTGAGFQFIWDRETLRRQWAWWWRYRRWHGIDLDEPMGTFGGREIVPRSARVPPFWRRDPLTGSLWFSQYHLSRERVRDYVAAIERSGLRWLHGYPSVVALLAMWALEEGLDLRGRVRWVTLGAESLLEHQARAIERAFGVRPLQHYGLAEGVAGISQCPLGSLHVDEDFALVDLEPLPGQPGQYALIGTALSGVLQPLVRWATGDVVRYEPEDRCECGRSGRVVRGIDGRQEDFVVLSDGSYVGRLDHLFKDAIHVREAQIHQQEPGLATLRIVRAPAYGEADEEALREEIRLRVGTRLRVRFEYPESLPRTGRGKLRLVVSEIASAGIGEV